MPRPVDTMISMDLHRSRTVQPKLNLADDRRAKCTPAAVCQDFITVHALTTRWHRGDLLAWPVCVFFVLSFLGVSFLTEITCSVASKGSLLFLLQKRVTSGRRRSSCVFFFTTSFSSSKYQPLTMADSAGLRTRKATAKAAAATPNGKSKAPTAAQKRAAVQDEKDFEEKKNYKPKHSYLHVDLNDDQIMGGGKQQTVVKYSPGIVISEQVARPTRSSSSTTTGSSAVPGVLLP